MNYLNICRICLEYDANINWNEELLESPGVSYRDCYYKYTQMEEIDKDLYSINLCERCAEGVGNAHHLFEKALKSFIILQSTTNTKDCEALYLESFNSLSENDCIESFKNERVDMDIDEVIYYSPVREDDQAEVQEEYDKVVTNSPAKNTCSLSSRESTTEKQAPSSFDIKFLLSKVDEEQIKKRRYVEALNMGLELKLQLQISDKKILKSLAYKNGEKNCKSSPQNIKPLQSNPIPSTSTTDQLKHKNKSVLGDIPRRKTSLKVKSKQKTTLSNHPSFDNKISENIDLQQTNGTQALEKGQENSNSSNMQISNPMVDDTSANSFEILNSTISNKDQLENYLTMENNSEPEKLNTNSFNLEEEHTSVETTDCNDKKKLPYKPSEIALLKKIYGNDFDMKSKKLKTKSQTGKAKEKVCQYCSLVVLGINSLLSHEATHFKRERTETCPKCGMKFFKKDTLKEHMKTHDENRRKEHKCRYCEKAFYNVGGRNVHERIHLGLMVKCPICPKEFYRQIDLDKHLPSHSVEKTGASKKVNYKVLCQYCNKYIKTASWKAHKAEHLKEPQVKCKICEREFYSRTTCIKHIRGKHRKTDDPQQYIHYFNKNRLSHLLLKQQGVVEMVTEQN